MQTKVDQLLKAFSKVLEEPWSNALSGDERIWFLVYDPAEQRKVDLRMADFETEALKAGKKWKSISLKKCFPTWMTNHLYRDGYFKKPDLISDQIETEFRSFAIQYLKGELKKVEPDLETIVVLTDVSSLFGFVKLSEIINNCEKDFKGRLLIFFPGEFEKNQYRLLAARGGWNYLARPITI